MKKLVTIALLATLAASCGGVRHVVTVSALSAHATVAAVQDTADLVMCGAPTALPAPKCLTEPQRKELHLSDALAVDIALLKAVHDWPVGAPQPAVITAYVAEISRILTEAVNALPESPAKAKLKKLLGV